MITEQLKIEILAHAKKSEPQESCGFVVSGQDEFFYYPCENVAGDPESFFEIAPEAYIQTESLGEIVAIVHSHPNGEPVLSIADRQMQDLSQSDWWLVCNGELHIFPKIQPLIGREFIHGTTDCYSIYKDFYYLAGLDMDEFKRQDYWWEKGENLYLENIEGQGFERLPEDAELQIGDVILMQVGASVPNHAGIYIGNQMVLHHSPNRLSKRDLYDGYWFKHTHSIWRYKRWSQLDFTAALNNLARSLS